jgi:DNA (cytosine-5)-methyltransferase 1
VAAVIYGSVCSGIEAASVAWHPLGWRPAFFSEIEPFPRSVLAHHYPDVPLHGDFTTIKAGDYAAIDVLVGGTPCQSFSVAGLRGGMADERGNLALEYLRLADRLRPRWLVWENVPGVLSSAGGRDFGAFLGGLAELGYGWAYRVLDAQYAGLAQRRKRVFVVGCAGDWRGAAAVLFERHSLSGHPAPRRSSGERIANCLTDRADRGGTNSEGQRLIPDVARCVATREGSSQDYETTTMIAHALRAEGFDASEDGTGRGTPLVPITFGAQMSVPQTDVDMVQTLQAKNPMAVTYAFKAGQSEAAGGAFVSEDYAPTLQAVNNGSTAVPAVAFDLAQITSAANRTRAEPGLPASTMLKASRMHVAQPMAVRRLTPRECERLQGFPDDYTAVLHRGKPAADGPRYKALGNSMAVPVMGWIGQRIAQVEALSMAEAEAA